MHAKQKMFRDKLYVMVGPHQIMITTLEYEMPPHLNRKRRERGDPDSIQTVGNPL
jgi:hypothetical protein